MKRARIFLIAYVFGLFLISFLVFSINKIIDPFGINRYLIVARLNDRKAGQGNHVRMSKAGAVNVLKPRGVILGNSRAEIGINPLHPGWKTSPVYNLGISGSNIYEITRYFQHTHQLSQLKQVLFVLDLNQFFAHWKNAPDYSENRLSVSYEGHNNPLFLTVDVLPTTLSTTAILESIRTIWRSYYKKNVTYLLNGQRDWHNDVLFRTVRSRGGYSSTFAGEEKSLFRVKDLRFNPNYIESFVDPETGYSVFDPFRRLLQIAYKDNIDFKLVIGPSHARYFECHRLAGNWYLWEEWKRILVRIVEEEAVNANIQPFELWDFSGFNALTAERVPKDEDRITHMMYYFESSHFSTDLGDLVQDRVFNHEDPGREVPGYFGVLINSGNIESHLRKIRQDNKKFRSLQPDVANELSTLASSYDISDSYARDIYGNNITYKW